MSAASLHSTLSAGHEDATYEANKARQSTERNADRIHWDPEAAFRDAPYRQLHHQRGVVGSFRVRLLEASDLQRSYWSALALGPVKHLGWSKAHGAVSACCAFDLECSSSCSDPDGDTSGGGGESDDDRDTGTPPWNNSGVVFSGPAHLDRKPAAKKRSPSSNHKPAFTSPVVPANDHPVWDNCQFDCLLRKGAAGGRDGHRVLLKVRVHEDATALENLLPGVPGGSDAARLLGAGTLDLTELCLGETSTGQPLPGVLDAWVPLSLPHHQQQMQREWWEAQLKLKGTDDPLALAQLKPPPMAAGKSTGAVRVLVSYRPHGLEPQVHDVVALEAFARRDPATSSCRPLLPPLRPLVVLERRGPYLLAEYRLPETSSSSLSVMGRTAKVRLHRNAVFVVERKNWVDAAHNLALLPVDAVAATPLGRAAAEVLHPIVAASRELLMPALLSLKLVWVAARTTTLASLSGVQALGHTFWQEGTGSLLQDSSSSAHSSSVHSTGSSSVASSTSRRHHDRASATAQFVSL